MAREWTADQLRFLAGSSELQISAPRADAEPSSWVPIWVVVVGEEVFVRTWYRRSTGWYGRAIASEEAWIRLAGDPSPVLVTSVEAHRVDAVNAAYQAKYGAAGATSMLADEAAASTLRLTPA